MKPRMGVFALLAVLMFAVTASRPALAQLQFSFDKGYPQQSGEDLYQNLCQGCHMSDARGAIGAGAYPALARNPRLSAAIYPITLVLHGQRAMPPFDDSLSDQQIANVINYVRTHFGNRYKDQVTPAMVQAQRH
jgi:mono/diheme cytochrome c family protein